MPTAAIATPPSALVGTLFRRPARPTAAPRPSAAASPRPSAAARRSISCQVALTTDVSSSSSQESVAEEEAEAAAKIGARIRVKAPLKVYHVMKAPKLELNGMEGVIKQYVGVWKGKRISANLPFRVEFVLPGGVEGKPIKFIAHLREDEFEYLPSD